MGAQREEFGDGFCKGKRWVVDWGEKVGRGVLENSSFHLHNTPSISLAEVSGCSMVRLQFTYATCRHFPVIRTRNPP